MPPRVLKKWDESRGPKPSYWIDPPEYPQNQPYKP